MVLACSPERLLSDAQTSWLILGKHPECADVYVHVHTRFLCRTEVMTSSPIQLRTMLLQRALSESRHLVANIERSGEAVLLTGNRLARCCWNSCPPRRRRSIRRS